MTKAEARPRPDSARRHPGGRRLRIEDVILTVFLRPEDGLLSGASQDAALSARCGSFQPGRTKWQVYPFGYFCR